MPRLLLALTLLIAAPTHAQRPPLRVLFIGNSYTYFNNLPALVSDLGRQATPSRRVTVAMVVRGGATLRDHWLSGEALAALRRERWDLVVLQEQSMLGVRLADGQPAVNDPAFFHRFARLFAAEIRRAGATPVFYLTWSRRATPGTQARLTEAYTAIASETGGRIAAVGEAWQRVRQQRPDLELYDPDGSHPSPMGSYVAALALWSTIARVPATGLPSRLSGRQVADSGLGTRLADRETVLVSLGAQDAAALQRAVDEATQALANRARQATPAGAPRDEAPAPFALDRLVGRWRGTMRLYDEPVDVELVISMAGGALRAEWREEAPTWTATRVLPDVRLEGGRLHFTVPDPRFLAPAEVHRATLRGDTLTGEVSVGTAAAPPYLTGGWQLLRATSPR